jgi:hypothetical protein
MRLAQSWSLVGRKKGEINIWIHANQGCNLPPSSFKCSVFQKLIAIFLNAYGAIQ